MVAILLSKNSLKKLETLHSSLVLVVKDVSMHYSINVKETDRSLELQKQYLKEGKTKTLKSMHLVDKDHPKARAVDMVPYLGPVDIWDTKSPETRKAWEDFAACVFECANARGIRLRWGGDFNMDGNPLDQKEFIDCPHWELA